MSGNRSKLGGGWAGSGCNNSTMGLFSQLFHSKPTASPQLPREPFIADLQEQIRINARQITQLSEDLEELKETTSRKLKRYAAWAQPRKDGKFGPQGIVESDNGSPLIHGYGSVPTPTHDQIEAMARERNLLK